MQVSVLCSAFRRSSQNAVSLKNCQNRTDKRKGDSKWRRNQSNSKARRRKHTVIAKKRFLGLVARGAYVQISASCSAFRRSSHNAVTLTNFTIEPISGKTTSSGAENKVIGERIASKQLASIELLFLGLVVVELYMQASSNIPQITIQKTVHTPNPVV